MRTAKNLIETIKFYSQQGENWHIASEQEITIQWTFDTSWLIHILKRGDILESTEGVKISAQNISQISPPGPYLKEQIEKSITAWEVVFKTLKKFNINLKWQKVTRLHEVGGVIFAGCAPYHKLNYSAFTTSRFNKLKNVLSHEIVCLPNDEQQAFFRTYALDNNYFNVSIDSYVRELITHEIGHAVGLAHLPKNFIERIQTGIILPDPVSGKPILLNACNATVMIYRYQVCEPMMTCLTEVRFFAGTKICYELYPMEQPGILDLYALGFKYSAKSLYFNITNWLLAMQSEPSIIEPTTHHEYITQSSQPEPVLSGYFSSGAGIIDGFCKEMFLAMGMTEQQAKFTVEGIVASMVATVNPYLGLTYCALNRLPNRYYIQGIPFAILMFSTLEGITQGLIDIVNNLIQYTVGYQLGKQVFKLAKYGISFFSSNANYVPNQPFNENLTVKNQVKYKTPPKSN